MICKNLKDPYTYQTQRNSKSLLNQKGVEFDETDVFSNPDEKPNMIKRANGARTVPQIFIGDIHVGGCDELFALERAGHLDGMLAA